MKPTLLLLSFVLLFGACKKNNDTPSPAPETIYFPNNTDNTWETKSMSSLGWNEANVPALRDFLIQTNTKSFMILVNGRIVMEEYYNGHTSTATWPWNSAGKTLVGTITGIAQQENVLAFNDRVSKHIGVGWTSAPLDKENLITVKHLLTMTSGLNDANELITASTLTYLADAGTRWSYHNVFQKLMDVTGNASSQGFEAYFNSKIKNKLGMDGFWNNGLVFKVYHSNTRSMARFGLLALNKGKWKTDQVVNESFFNESINTSQSINPAYGYFWWLNGKTSAMLPGSQTVYQGTLVPNAPAEMYAAMGAADQRIYVVPGKKMVIIRMGEVSDPSNPSFALSGYDNNLWAKINTVVN